MDKSDMKNKKHKSTPWLLFQVVLSMLAFMGLVVLILSFNSIVVNLKALASPNKIILETFHFSKTKSFNGGSRGGQTTIYKFYGKHPLFEKPFTLSVTTDELERKERTKIIYRKNAKIWILNSNNYNIGAFQKAYPNKKDYLWHIFIGLFFIFFGPLFTIILFFIILGKDFINLFRETPHNLENMEKIILFLFLFPIGLSAQSQPTEYQAYPITLCTEVTNEDDFHVYDPPFKAKGVYSNLSEVSNAYPEQVLQSVMSATSQEWIDFNTYGGLENSKKRKLKAFLKKLKRGIEMKITTN